MAIQNELLRAETTWFHVFKAMIDSGDMAKLSGSSVKLYLVIKSYTNFSTGNSFPSMAVLTEKTGISIAQVHRCLKELESFGYISKSKAGRNNVYTLREKVQFQDNDGRPTAVATWDYIPNAVKEAQAELSKFKLTGQHDGQIVSFHIDHAVFNIQQVIGDGNSDITQVVDASEAAKEGIENIRKALHKQS